MSGSQLVIHVTATESKSIRLLTEEGKTDIDSLLMDVLNSGQTRHWSSFKSSRSWEMGRSSDPLDHPSICPLFCAAFLSVFKKLAGWSIEQRPHSIGLLSLLFSFACSLLPIHPSVLKKTLWLCFSFILLCSAPHCLHQHSSSFVSSMVVSMCLYAPPGSGPLHPSLKRTEGLGPEPAGVDSL